MNADHDAMTGTTGADNCDNADGCPIKDTSTASTGAGFNKGNGGVYAMEWTAKSVKVWWWARNKIPSDIGAGKPNPQGWPVPVASFSGSGCDFDKLFSNHQIVGLQLIADFGDEQSLADRNLRYLISPFVAIGLGSRRFGTSSARRAMGRRVHHMCWVVRMGIRGLILRFCL